MQRHSAAIERVSGVRMLCRKLFRSAADSAAKSEKPLLVALHVFEMQQAMGLSNKSMQYGFVLAG